MAEGLDVVGLVVIIVFYLLILAVGIASSYWFKKKYARDGMTDEEANLVAGRKISGVVGIFTMTATTVGGGYINGTAESIATQGLVWTLAPFGIFIGLMIAGLCYAKKMREKNYMTMLDPLQQKYGDTMVGLLYLAAICGDIFWSASILAALGTSLSVIIGLEVNVAIIGSAVIAVLYTAMGQMVSVAYTDIIQLILITFGLVLCIPFSYNTATESPDFVSDRWIGSLEPKYAGLWADLAVAMTLGTIPWQTYFQRVLSVKTPQQARLLSFAAAFGALILAIPPIFIGAIGTGADWNSTDLGYSPLENDQGEMILPLVMKYLTPRPVSIIGLGAISAAVMSSVDSAILSSASLFTHNIYAMLRKKATQLELTWAQRISLVLLGALATALAIFVQSIYFMFILAADIVFVIMLPQLTSALFIERSNTYGALVGYVLGLLLRFLAGEPLISLPTVIKYPFYDAETDTQLFPFRTFAATISFTSIVLVSLLARLLFTRGIIDKKYDYFNCVQSQERGCPLDTDPALVSTNKLMNGSAYKPTPADDSEEEDPISSIVTPNGNGTIRVSTDL